MSINRWMDKEDVVNIHSGILLSHNKEWNLAICSNTDGLGGHYAKWNKSDRERQMLYDITYMWSLKKYNKLVDITKKKQTWIQKTNEWLPVCGGYSLGVRDQEVQTTGYKIGSRMYITWGIEPIFGNNCKWKVTFKIVFKFS